MKKRFRPLLLSSLILVFCVSCATQKTNQKSKTKENNKEWISLFNGKDLSGWTIKIADQEIDYNLNKTFIVEDSMIRIRYDDYDEFNDAFGHMYYKTPFSSYKLAFDYRFVRLFTFLLTLSFYVDVL